MKAEARFEEVYRRKWWAAAGVLSGHGSRVGNCTALIDWLEACADVGLRTVLDLGCGDLEWVARCGAITDGRLCYEGWDVVPALVAHHRRVFPWYRGRVVDVEEVPRLEADVVICKDVIFHHCNGAAEQFLMNLNAGRWRRLLVTSHPGADRAKRHGLHKGGWAPYDVEAAGIIEGKPAQYLPRYDGVHLVYQRDGKEMT
jgi:hypothetical protein